MLLGAYLLALLTVSLDGRFDFSSLELSIIYLSQPDGARSLLSTVAGSMLSVASLTFSIVMVVLTMASSQFGPRLLGNFMRDRGNQFVLGSFISTFLYCLLVLRTVRGEGAEASLFVPQLSVTVALALAVVNLGAFIYFIHHTAENIQVATILAKVSGALTRKITDEFSDKTVFPEEVGESPEVEGEAELPAAFSRQKAIFHSAGGGYLSTVDEEGLLRVAKEENLVLKLLRSPGAYIRHGGPLLAVYPGSVLTACQERLKNKVALDNHRTPDQDLEFLFDQLLEVALRALSPGVNDPITAMRCIDRIGDNLSLLASRELPSPYRFDENGELRLIIPVVDAAALVKRLFGPIRSYAAADYMTLSHLIHTLGEMSQATSDSVFRQALFEEADLVTNQAEAQLATEDYQRLLEVHSDVRGTVA